MNFEQLKAEYSNIKTMESRKLELILLMQNNLKERCDKESIICLDNKEYSLTSDNVEELYAIDGKLSAEACKSKNSKISDIEREKQMKRNLYGPDKPYPKNANKS